jgi:hypothetical protein
MIVTEVAVMLHVIYKILNMGICERGAIETLEPSHELRKDGQEMEIYLKQ